MEKKRMSDLWAYLPAYCDGDFCPLDCDRCQKGRVTEEERAEELALRREIPLGTNADVSSQELFYIWLKILRRERDFNGIYQSDPKADSDG